MPRSIILGSHAYFAREGDIIDTVTVGRTSKPDNDPAANWMDMGIIGDVGVNATQNEIVIKRPMPGQMVDYDTIMSNAQAVYNLQLREGSPLAWEMLFGSDKINPAASSNPGAFVPLKKTAFLKGWLKIQMYDQNNALINVVDLYTSLRLDGTWTAAMAQTDPITFALAARQLYSPLNSGQLSNLV